MQLGHAFMKQAVKKKEKFEDAENTVNVEVAIQAYQEAKRLYPVIPSLGTT